MESKTSSRATDFHHAPVAKMILNSTVSASRTKAWKAKNRPCRPVFLGFWAATSKVKTATQLPPRWRPKYHDYSLLGITSFTLLGLYF